MTPPLWRNSKFYGLLGLILVAAPTLYFFFEGMPGTGIKETVYPNGSRTTGVETVSEGAFNPAFLYFVAGSIVATWGCYRSRLLAWIGSIFLLALSFITLFSIGILTFPGTLLLLVGATLKTYKYPKTQ